jgi:acetyltransferase
MMAPSVLTPLFARGIGVTWAVTSGNEADVDLADYIRYFVADEQTRVIGCFAEQIKRPAAFIDACALAADARKPIVMLKIGRSEASRRAALGHTGSLVGADGVIDAVLRKHGVTRVASVDEMFEALAVFHTRRLPRGNGLAAISVSGGAAGLMSDLAPDCGVQFATLTDATQVHLREVVPEFGSVGNPLDVTGQGVYQPELLERSLDLLARDPGVDAIVYARPFPARLDGATPAVQALVRSIETNPQIPLLAMSLAGGHFFPAPTADIPIQDPRDSLDGVPLLQGAEYGLKAVGALMRYATFLRHRARLREPIHSPRLSNPRARETAQQIVAQAHSARLSAVQGSAMLAAYGIPAPAEALARNRAEAVAIAERVGYPVAAKVEALSLAHKAQAGGVALGLATPAAVDEAFGRLQSVAPDPEGVLIQHMVGDSQVELIVGMSRDPQFGTVIACGLGGVFVETLRDVQLLLPPVSVDEARAALSRLRGAAVLERADVDAVVDVLLRFAEMCVELEDLVSEIDLNPLIARSAGHGAVVVDSLFGLDR